MNRDHDRGHASDDDHHHRANACGFHGNGYVNAYGHENDYVNVNDHAAHHHHESQLLDVCGHDHGYASECGCDHENDHVSACGHASVHDLQHDHDLPHGNDDYDCENANRHFHPSDYRNGHDHDHDHEHGNENENDCGHVSANVDFYLIEVPTRLFEI